jgi:hypothetical protein
MTGITAILYEFGESCYLRYLGEDYERSTTSFDYFIK